MRRTANRLRHGGARHWAAPFVLAMLCLRALVPAGFMLAPIDGRLEIVLCDSSVPSLGHHHHHSGYDPTTHHHNGVDPTCPYAQSSGPAPLPALPAMAAAPVASAPVVQSNVSQTHATFGPARQQTPRGPPL